MNKIWLVLAGALVTTPVLAQDPPADETAPVEGATTDEGAAADAAAPADDASAASSDAAGSSEADAGSETEATADSGDAGTTESGDAAATESADTSGSDTDASASSDASTETASEDASSGESASSEEPREPRQFYLAAEAARLWASLSEDRLQAQFGGEELDSHFYRVRFGTRVFGAIGLEVQGGIGDGGGEEPGKAKVDSYWGVYAVPTGLFMDLVEVSVPIGYSWTKLSNDAGGDASFSGVSFGLNLELPVQVFGDSLPNLRLTAGGVVYQVDRDSRVYGAQAGLRYDFAI